MKRVLLLMNITWVKSLNRLDISTVEILLIIKINLKICLVHCSQFYESILDYKTLLQKIIVQLSTKQLKLFCQQKTHRS